MAFCEHIKEQAYQNDCIVLCSLFGNHVNMEKTSEQERKREDEVGAERALELWSLSAGCRAGTRRMPT